MRRYNKMTENKEEKDENHVSGCLESGWKCPILTFLCFKTYLSSEKFGSNKYFSLFCTQIEDRKYINKV